MKKLLVIILAMTLTLTLVACGVSDNNDPQLTQQGDDNNAETPADDTGESVEEIIREGDYDFKSVEGGISLVRYYGSETNESETNISIPVTLNGKTVVELGEHLFNTNEFLTTITIPDSVTKINDFALSRCENLVEIKLGMNNPNYTVEDGVLFSKDKTVLIQYPLGREPEDYIIPDGVTSIGNSSFHSSKITGITIPETVTTLNWYSFENCQSLTSIVIPGSVTYIGFIAFADCVGLKSVEILEGATVIESQAFLDCVELESVTIPDSMMEVRQGVFDGCEKLTSITYKGEIYESADTFMAAFNG